MGITIKPHHFMDILKLYGGGIEVFVPDEKMRHDFYKVGNMILGNHQALLTLTVGSDDICMPCNQCKASRCVDGLEHVPNFTSKERYNHELDTRIMDQLKLDCDRQYQAKTLCSIMLAHHEFIYSVWLEEDDGVTHKRHDLFVAGAEKYLSASQE